jgi:hypothetical protein
MTGQANIDYCPRREYNQSCAISLGRRYLGGNTCRLVKQTSTKDRGESTYKNTVSPRSTGTQAVIPYTAAWIDLIVPLRDSLELTSLEAMEKHIMKPQKHLSLNPFVSPFYSKPQRKRSLAVPRYSSVISNRLLLDDLLLVIVTTSSHDLLRSLALLDSRGLSLSLVVIIVASSDSDSLLAALLGSGGGLALALTLGLGRGGGSGGGGGVCCYQNAKLLPN